MNRFLDALGAGPLLADGAMGSYIFELTGRLSEPNHVYESFSLDRPEVIRDVYLGYLRAGSRCLTTNTFAANADCLAVDGLAERLVDLNRAAIDVAREAAEQYRASEGGEEIFVLASVGPTTDPDQDDASTFDAYQEQLAAISGADALLLETFRSLASLRQVLSTVAQIPNRPPIIAQMAVQQDANGWSTSPSELVDAAVAGGAAVVGVNCCTPWDAETILDWGASQIGHNGQRPIVNCIYYGAAFVSVAQAVNIPARCAVFTDVQPDGWFGHFAAEFWSVEHNKWVMVDPNTDAIYWREGQPMSVREIQEVLPDLERHIEFGVGTVEQRKNPRMVKWLADGYMEGKCFRHRAVWYRADLLTHPELSPPAHGSQSYCETGLIWEDHEKDLFGMFPYFGAEDYFEAPPEGRPR